MSPLTYNINKIRTGDIILCKGNSLIGRLISIVDKSYWSHIGVLVIDQGEVFIIDSNEDGVRCRNLKDRLRKYSDIHILRPIDKDGNLIDAFAIEKHLGNLYKATEKSKGYDFILLIALGVQRLTGLKLDWMDSHKRFICSELVYEKYARHILPNHKILESPKDFAECPYFKLVPQ